MRTALITSGKGNRPVVDIVIAGDGYEAPDGLVAVASDTANVGDLYDGKSFTPAAPPELAGDALDAFKTTLMTEVDGAAERIRQLYITPGSGQSMEYQAAQDEARFALAALAASPSADLNPLDYPMLAASIGSSLDPTTGKASTDLAGEARGIDSVRKAWLAVAAPLREVRLNGKRAIADATSREAAQAAFDAVVWPKLS